MIKPFLAGVAITTVGAFAWNEVAVQSFESKLIDRVPSVTALCRDGTYSTAEHKRGQCSGHGGVKRWIIRQDD